VVIIRLVRSGVREMIMQAMTGRDSKMIKSWLLLSAPNMTVSPSRTSLGRNRYMTAEWLRQHDQTSDFRSLCTRM
jgi:hypothetical protein